MDSYPLQEYRCDSCHKLIIKGMLLNCYAEFKCLRCGRMLRFKGVSGQDIPVQYLILTNEDGIITNASMSVQHNIGFSPTDLLGKHIGMLYGSSDAHADKVLSEKCAQFKYLRLDAMHKTKEGGAVPVALTFKSFVYDGHLNVLRVVNRVMPRDASSEARSTFSEDNYCDFEADIDTQGNLLYLDRRVEKIFGFKPEEIVGRPVTEFFVKEERGWRSVNAAVALSRGDSFRIPNYKTIHKDGTPIEYEAYCTLNRDELGNIVGYRCMNWLKKGSA